MCGRSSRRSILERPSLLMKIFYIKEEYFEEIEKIQRSQPYIHTSYNKNCNLWGPWVVLAENKTDLVLITPYDNIPRSLQSQRHCLFGVKKEYLLTIEDIRDLKIDKII